MPIQIKSGNLTENGIAFLKCAYAPPDFNTDPGKGIPDLVQGKVLCKKHVLTNDINFTAGNRTVLVIPPVPGVAYYSAEGAPSASLSGKSLTATGFPGFTSLFGTKNTNYADQVNEFRYASLAVGIYPTSNNYQFAGSIKVYKAPLKQTFTSYSRTITTTPAVDLTFTALSISGLEAVDTIGNDNFATSFIDGCFSQSVNRQPEFTFSPIIEGNSSVPSGTTTLAEAGQYCTLTNNFTGLGDMDSIIIVVNTPASATNTAVIKVWACVEYKVNPASILYDYAGDSPPLDEAAMQAYRDIAKQIPVAVRAEQNAEFWDRVKNILGKTYGFAKALPGPVGDTTRSIDQMVKMLMQLYV